MWWPSATGAIACGHRVILHIPSPHEQQSETHLRSRQRLPRLGQLSQQFLPLRVDNLALSLDEDAEKVLLQDVNRVGVQPGPRLALVEELSQLVKVGLVCVQVDQTERSRGGVGRIQKVDIAAVDLIDLRTAGREKGAAAAAAAAAACDGRKTRRRTRFDPSVPSSSSSSTS
jgi:hypothetical protein